MRPNVRIVLLGFTLCLFLAGCSLFKSEEEKGGPKQVTYRVTSQPVMAVDVTYTDETGENVELTAVDPPWEYEFTAEPGAPLYLKGKRRHAGYATLRVIILLDGNTWKEKDCVSQYCSVSISGAVP